jgi:hypothetical protein
MVIATTIIIYLGLFFFPLDKDHFISANKTKHELLKNTSSPRIILIGGSGVAFGIDSNQLNNAFHLNIINMGLSAGIGLRLILNQTTNYIRKGDIIVIIPEYEFFFNDFMDGNGTILASLISSDPTIIKYFNSINLYVNLLNNYNRIVLIELMSIISKSINKSVFPIDKIYQISSFNKYGDLIIPPGSKAINIDFNSNYCSGIFNHKAITVINEYVAQTKQRGGIIYFSFPAIAHTSFYQSKYEINKLYTILKSELKAPIIDAPQDNIYPDSIFFDTTYHLKAEGKNIRTIKLINNLKRYLK